MPKKEEAQAQSRILRSQGKSLIEIANLLQVAKSSVSVWTRDVVLTDSQKSQMRSKPSDSRKAARAKGSEVLSKKYAALREEAVKKGYALAASDPSFQIIVALYWGEGTNRGKSCCIANSDPRLLQIFCNWLNKNGYQWNLDIAYHEENDVSEQQIREHWNNYLIGAAKVSTRKYKPRKVTGNNKNRQPFGCGHIYVLSGLYLKLHIEGGKQYILDQNVGLAPKKLGDTLEGR